MTKIEFSQAVFLANEQQNYSQVAITLTRSGNLDVYSEVYVDVVGGNAERGADYDFLENFPVNVFFDFGETTKTIYVDIFPDDYEEGTENIIFEVTSPDSEVIGAQNTATLSIIDDDIANVEFSQAVYRVSEEENYSTATITLNRTGNLDNLSRVQVDINGGSASLGEDYESSLSQEVIFNPGESSRTINVEILPDYLEEGTEEINFSVASLENAFIGHQDTANITIIDDEVTNVGFAEASYVVSESEEATQAIITLVRTGDLNNFSEVRVDIAGGNAEIDHDFYIDLPESITFNPGEVYKTLVVEIDHDYQQEETELAIFTLTSLDNSTVISGNETTTVSILDYQSANIEFSQAVYKVAEDNETLEVVVPIIRSGNLDSSSEVRVNVFGGSALEGEDYYLFSDSVYFNSGESLATLRLEVNPDNLIEGTESINFSLSSFDNALIGSQDIATVEILDNEVAYVEFTETVYKTSEEETSQAVITLTRSGNLEEYSEVQIDFDGNAVFRQDFDIPYRSFPLSITFNPGETVKGLAIDILPDGEEEGTELVDFTLTSLDSNTYLSNQNTATLVIQDDDVTNVEFSQAIYTAREGNNNNYNEAAITLTRTGNISQASEVRIDIIGGSVSREDYYLPYEIESGTIYFEAGETTKFFLIGIDPDDEQEGTEKVNFALTSWDNNTIIGNQSEADLVIYDEDVANIEFSQTIYAASETDGNYQLAVILTRTGDIDNYASAQVTWIDGNAEIWNDFESPFNYQEEIRFSPGQTQDIVFFNIYPDTQLEGTESATFLLSAVENSAIGSQNTATILIQDNDVANVEFSQAVYETKEEFNNSQVAVSLTRSGNIFAPAEVGINFAGGDAKLYEDYDFPESVFFAAGETVKTFLVDIKPDTLIESTESIILTLSSNNGAVIGTQDTTTIEIIDDDGTTVEFSQADYVANEANYYSGSSQAEITLVRKGNIYDYADVRVEVVGGNADLYIDYDFDSQWIYFQPGEVEKTFLVDISSDNYEEEIESIKFALINQNNTLLGIQDTATLNIFDGGEVQQIEFSQATYIAHEDDNSTQAAITLKRTGEIYDSAEVGINLLGGSATVYEDYHFDYYYPEVAFFEPGQIETTVFVEISPDTQIEGTEFVSFSLTNINDYTYIGTQDTATLFIYDDEAATVEFYETTYSASEDDETSQAWITLTRSGNIFESSQVQLNISGGSADFDDYNYDNFVYFEAGETIKAIPVEIIPDFQQEGTESVFLSLTSIDSNTAIGVQNKATLSIFDDDVANVEFADAVYFVSEQENNPAQAEITLTRTGDVDNYSEVQINVIGGSADWYDYDLSYFPQQVYFDYGETSTTFWIEIDADNNLEGAESLNFSLTSLDNNTDIGTQKTATLLISDYDTSMVEFSQPEYIVREANGTSQAIITFTRTGNIDDYAEATVKFFGGSAKLGEDYNINSWDYYQNIFFEPGEVYTNLSLDILPDNLTEETETVYLSLSDYQYNSNTFIGNQETATLYIQDDEVANVEFAEATYIASEGKDISQVGITLTRNGNINSFAQVKFNWIGGEAQLNQDYQFEAEYVQFEPGETTKTVLVDILSDWQAEGTEEANFLLTSTDENVVIGSQDTTTLSIRDRDLPYVEFSQAIYTANEGNNYYPSQATIVLNRTGNLNEFSDVEVYVVGGSAIPNADYNLPDFRYNYSQTITFAPGETLQTFSVEIFSDTETELTESVLFSLTSQDEQTIIGNQNTTTLDILDNEVSNIEFSQAVYTTSEQNNQAFITLTRNGRFDEYAGVQVNIIGGDAQLDQDYSLASGYPETVFFAPGEIVKTFVVDILADSEEEGTEEITFSLYSDYSDAVIGNQNTATLYIQDDEVANVEFSQAVYNKTETDNPSPALITLTRTGNLAEYSEVQVNLSASNARRAEDYDFLESVTFAPGETLKVFSVDIFPDYELEGTESVSFSLVSTDNRTVIGNQNQTTLNIWDDEVANVEFSQPVYATTEADEPNYATIAVNRSGNLDIYSEVEVYIAGGSATQTEDFSFIDGNRGNLQYIYFEPGQTSKSFSVEIEDDWYEEGTESILFSLVSSNENTVVSSQSTTILNILDSYTTYVEFSQAVYTTAETDESSQAIITLERSGDIWRDLEVQVIPSGGTASINQDYTLPFEYPEFIFFAPGEATTDFVVNILRDSEIEGTEEVSFALMPSPGYALVGNQDTATLSILDDEVTNIEFSQAIYTTFEADNPSQAAITLKRSGDISTSAQIQVHVTGGNAQSDLDFSFPEYVDFASGEMETTFFIDILPDTFLERTEKAQFLLSSSAENVVIGNQNTATLSILDNEASYIEFSQAVYTVKESEYFLTEISQAVITLTRSGNISDYTDVKVNITDGTAQKDWDYDTDYYLPTYVSFAPGETVQTLLIDILSDGYEEGIESAYLSLMSTDENVVLGNQKTSILQIEDNIQGTNSDDILYGSQEDDVINALAGNDTLHGKQGNDIFFAGAGNDKINTGDGEDVVIFSSLTEAYDTITDFSINQDKIDINTILDSLAYDSLDPFADGFVNFKQINTAGGKIHTRIDIDSDGKLGDESFQKLVLLRNTDTSGLTYDNTFITRHSEPRINAITGTELLDKLTGLSGNDHFVGLAGDDKITTGSGEDVVILSSLGDGYDRIMDFNLSQDFLDVSGVLTEIGYVGGNPLADGVLRWKDINNNTGAHTRLDIRVEDSWQKLALLRDVSGIDAIDSSFLITEAGG